MGKSFISKLCYRIVNAHSATFSANSTFYEALYFDPRNFFGGEKKQLKKIFDNEEMRRWIAHLHDVDSEGLPKALVKEHWDRRLLKTTVVLRGGIRYLDWQIQVFEYNSATDKWDRLRCSTCFQMVEE
jgi:hypothetical protein